MLSWDNVKPIKNGHERYMILVDGEKIGKIDIPKRLKHRPKDGIRQEIARELGIPVHYLRLRPEKYKT